MTASVLLCEGYHDRAFWSGLLTHLGCIDPGQPMGSSRRSQVLDPWGGVVRGGLYAYHSLRGDFIVVVPCHGKQNVLPAARNYLRQRGAQPLVRLVLNVDADASAAVPGSAGLKRVDVENELRQIDSAAKMNADGEIEIDSGATKVSLIRWETSDVAQDGLPEQQTLERLVSAALIAAYPARAKAVQSWLNSRPEPPAVSPKDHAWSYMAGWYAELGCDAFYAHVWKDAAVVQELELRLRASGAWRIAELLST